MVYIHGVAFQVKAFFQAVGLGFILGVLYDVFRFLRWLAGNRLAAVFDGAFCLLAAFADFCFILAFHDGMFRTYLFAGEGAGFAAYYVALGRLNFRIGTAVSHGVHRAASRLRQGIITKKETLQSKIKSKRAEAEENKEKS